MEGVYGKWEGRAHLRIVALSLKTPSWRETLLLTPVWRTVFVSWLHVIEFTHP